MRKMTTFLSLLALLSIVFSPAVFAARTTRDLVFEEEAPADSDGAQEQAVGVKTTVLLTRGGEVSTVLPSHEFKSGDSIKLVFTPSVDGYVYWMAKGSTGAISVLFPSVQAGMDNSVKRNQEYTVPSKGAFRFDDNAGQEELLCILSTEKLADLDKAIQEKGKVNEDGSTYVAELEEKKESGRKTRDLVFEEEDEGDVNTQQQSASVKEPFVGHYILTHK